MLFTKRPEFRRPPQNRYREGSLVNRATGVFSWLHRGIFGALTIILLLLTATVAGDLPTTKKGWLAWIALIVVGVVVGVVAV